MKVAPLVWERRFPPCEPQGVVVPLPDPGLGARLDAALAEGRRLALDRSAHWLVVRALDGAPPPWFDHGTFVAPDPDEARLWTPTHRRPCAPPAALWHALVAQLGPGRAPRDGGVLLPGQEPTLIALGPAWAVTATDLA